MSNTINSRSIERKIRKFSRKNDLRATSRTKDDGYGVRFRYWWFGDYNNLFVSPECGLCDDEALVFLTAS